MSVVDSPPPWGAKLPSKIPFLVFATQEGFRYTFNITPVAPLPLHRGDVHQGRVFLLLVSGCSGGVLGHEPTIVPAVAPLRQAVAILSRPGCAPHYARPVRPRRSRRRAFSCAVNYYRLSGYCLAFEQQRRTFLPGVTFDDVAGQYAFDVVLRDLLTEALEVIEIDVRALPGIQFRPGARSIRPRRRGELLSQI